MKVAILAGGLGTRLGEKTSVRPKPMVEIGGKPILWHIMKIYSRYGFNDFVILTGYKSEYIKNYFLNYYTQNSDFTIDLSSNSLTIHRNVSEPWKVSVIDTGRETLTGGRIKRAQEFLSDDTFMLTYGDGVSDVDISKLVEFHKRNGKYATLTAVQPQGRFGVLDIDGDSITSFQEKPKNSSSAWINGGFFVLEPEIFKYIKGGDSTVWEREPLMSLAKDGQLCAYKHNGFWHPMDMLKDKQELNKLWNSNNAPWKVWNE